MAYLFNLIGILHPSEGIDGVLFRNALFMSNVIVSVIIAILCIIMVYIYISFKKDLINTNVRTIFWTFLVLTFIFGGIASYFEFHRNDWEYFDVSGSSIEFTQALLAGLTSILLFWILGFIIYHDYIKSGFKYMFPNPLQSKKEEA